MLEDATKSEMESWVALLCTLFAIIDITAIVLNLIVIVVILRTSHLRYNLTNSFVMNLCGADLICSLVIMPMWIVCFGSGRWIYPAYVCDIYGYMSAALSYETIWTICLIGVERYYSIALPMLHAANMTLGRTIAAIVSSWLVSGLFAAIPAIYNQECRMAYEVEGYLCWSNFSGNESNNVHWITVGVVCFCIPTVIVLGIYVAIFRIAQKARRNVAPAIPSNPANRNIGTLSAVTLRASIESLAPSKRPSVIMDVLLPKVSHALRVGKAARTVLAVSGLFLLLWMPHFVVLFYGSLHTDFDNRKVMAIVDWLAFLTLLANPTIYGIYNRAIRQAITDMLNTGFRCFKAEHKPADDIGDEDFLQFLERTSTSGRNGQSRSSSSTLNVEQRY